MKQTCIKLNAEHRFRGSYISIRYTNPFSTCFKY